MRRAAKVDGNQRAVVDALRAAGCTVVSMAALGDGAPDLLVGYQGNTVLLEVKDGAQRPSARKLTPLQEKWHAGWRGRPVLVVNSADEALAVIRPTFPL